MATFQIIPIGKTQRRVSPVDGVGRDIPSDIPDPNPNHLGRYRFKKKTQHFELGIADCLRVRVRLISLPHYKTS